MDTTITQENILQDLFLELIADRGFSQNEKNTLFEKLEATIMLSIAAELFTNLDAEARNEIPDDCFSSYKTMFDYLSKHIPKEYFSEVVAHTTEAVFAEFLNNLK